ncbi:hypothetical protein B0H16DRAFT_1660643 [Mycena metata]|uniref:Uncharacterized protein n=1 Tax=Mycena metata TaxID=1033252 RepID=A0AAD7JTV0_9AGAR|nr:hypothetical protein B0H16DRAFT_1660643 [Mycena metata]
MSVDVLDSTAPQNPDRAAFCTLLDDITTSLAATRTTLASLRAQESSALAPAEGISLLGLKAPLLLSYLQSLLLLTTHRALGHTYTSREPPPQPFSSVSRGARGTEGGDVVDALVEGRVVLEKVRALEGRMRYQIEKLVRAATAPENDAAGGAVDDPLAFRPNPANLANDGEASDVSDAEIYNPYERRGGRGDEEDQGDGIYRPPRLAPVPYTGALPATKGKRTRAAPIPSALRSLADPLLPHAESTSGLGNTKGAGQGSARAAHLRRLQEFEEENFGRVVLGKGAARARARDEEDLALGAELGAARGGGRNRRRGGLEDEFGDVLRSVDRVGVRGGTGDGYDELRRGGKKKGVLERARANVRVREEPEEEVGRVRKKSRFEQDTKVAKRRIKRNST